MASPDPLRIRGQKPLTDEERAQVMAFAEATGRPPKFCRAALIEAKWDETEARRLIDDEKFIRMNTDFDLSTLMSLTNPADVSAYFTRQTMTHAGKSDAEIEAATASNRAEVEKIQEASAASERSQSERAKRLNGREVDDPTFGKLVFDAYAWEGTVDLPPFGTGLSLAVEPDEEDNDAPPPTDRQRAAFETFRQDAAKIFEIAEQALFDDFRRIRDDLVAEQEAARKVVPDLGDDVPDPQLSKDIWDQVDDDPEIHVGPDFEDDAVTITVGYAVTWDVEHGDYLRFRDGELVETGPL